MKFVNIGVKSDLKKVLSYSEVEQIKFKFVPDLLNLQCCNRASISDGCEITLWDGSTEEICNNCLYELFMELSELIQKNKTKNDKLYELIFPFHTLNITYGSLIRIKGKLNKYFFALYKKHIRDDLFLDDTTEQRRFLERARSRSHEPSNEYKYTKPMSKGDKKKYYNGQHIINDLTRCDLAPITIQIDKTKNFKPVFELFTYSVISDIPCRIDEHNRFQEAVYAITDGRQNGFTFTFCPTHLYQFADVLMYFFRHHNFLKYSNGVFCIEKWHSGSMCYLTGIKSKSMYKLSLNKCNVVLSRTALNKIAVDVLTSTVFNELYPIEAAQFSFFLNQNKTNETELLKATLKEERQTNIEKRQKLLEYYDAETQKLAEKNEVLEEKNIQLNEEISEMKYKLNHIDDLIWEQKKVISQELRNKILNCLSNDNVTIIGVPKKTAKKNIIEEFKETFVYGISCTTFPHYSRQEEVVVLESGRKNNDLCFALCPICIEIILKGLKDIHNSKRYSNEAMNFEIIEIPSDSGNHCYNCGFDEGRVWQFRFGNKKFNLCSTCANKFEKQLMRINNKFIAARRFGGFNNFNQVLMLKSNNRNKNSE